MSFKSNQTAAFAARLLLIAILCAPAFSASTDDACTMLTQAEVSAAVRLPVGAGSHVTSTFLKACTWTPAGPGTGLKAVTLNLQTASAYDGAKSMTQRALAAAIATNNAHPPVIAAASLGDDAYFLDSTGITTLLVKKGAGAFKIAIYGKSPNDSQTAERNLAQQVLAKL